MGKKIHLTFDSVFDSDVILCKDDKDHLYAIPCNDRIPGRIMVISLLRRRRRNLRFTWLINGQAGRNAIEIAFWGEQHQYLLTIEEYVENGNRTRECWEYLLDHQCLILPYGWTAEMIRPHLPKDFPAQVC